MKTMGVGGKLKERPKRHHQYSEDRQAGTSQRTVSSLSGAHPVDMSEPMQGWPQKAALNPRAVRQLL